MIFDRDRIFYTDHRDPKKKKKTKELNIHTL